MPTARPREGGDKETKAHERERVKAVIGEQVLRTLGQPISLHQLQVRALWEDHYRVNVLVGVDAVNAKVAHSFFLVADSKGTITACNPKIIKHY